MGAIAFIFVLLILVRFGAFDDVMEKPAKENDEPMVAEGI